MAQLTNHQENILDLAGQPLLADSATFLKTMDRLLTVGSYYAEDHHQYLDAVKTACSSLLQAIQPRPALAVEITATGVLILDQTVDPHHLHARKLYDLLVALNIARMEFSARLTPEDLRATLHKLKCHRIDMEKTDGFREVVIKGLPGTVSIATRHIGNVDAGSMVDELISDIATDLVPEPTDDPELQNERLAKAFLELAEQLMANLESALEVSGETGDSGSGTAVTRSELAAIREGLRRLIELRPNPRELLRLIRHAKMAVDLSQDPGSVDLAFKILRAEMGVEAKPQNQTNRWVLEEDLSFTAEALHQAVAGLEYAKIPLTPALETARCDQLAVAFSLLSWDLEIREKARTLDLVEAVLADEQCGQVELDLVARGLLRQAAGEDERKDRWIAGVLRLVRQHQLCRLDRLWTQTLAEAEDETYETLWPHLVNDLLLGFGHSGDQDVGPLWALACNIGMGQVQRALETLKNLPSFGTAVCEPDTNPLLALPLTRTRPLHAVLMKSRFADQHGPRLVRALQRKPYNDLTRILVAALGQYEPQHRKLFFALICEGDLPQPSPRLGAMIGAVLAGELVSLPRADRSADWVAEATNRLPDLLGEEMRSLLETIRNESRLLILKAWPAPARRAASQALEQLNSAPARGGESA